MQVVQDADRRARADGSERVATVSLRWRPKCCAEHFAVRCVALRFLRANWRHIEDAVDVSSCNNIHNRMLLSNCRIALLYT